jgi:hypothetical protein
VRDGFVRKVFALVLLQLAVTVGIACVFMFVKPLKAREAPEVPGCVLGPAEAAGCRGRVLSFGSSCCRCGVLSCRYSCCHGDGFCRPVPPKAATARRPGAPCTPRRSSAASSPCPHPPLQSYVASSGGSWVFYTAWALSFVMLVALSCSTQLRKRHPWNVVALGAFTLVMSVLVGSICAYWDVQARSFLYAAPCLPSERLHPRACWASPPACSPFLSAGGVDCVCCDMRHRRCSDRSGTFYALGFHALWANSGRRLCRRLRGAADQHALRVLLRFLLVRSRTAHAAVI